MKPYCLLLLIVLLNACNDAESPKKETTEHAPKRHKKFPTDLPQRSRTGLNEAEIERRNALVRAIDSSYIVIDLLQLNKDSILAEPVAGMSRESINIRNRVIKEINSVQRAISMQVDQQILENLQLNCNHLRSVTADMTSDVGRLRKYGEGLARTANIVEGFSNFLSLCFLQGWVKPPTPKDEDSKKVIAKILTPS